LKKTYEDFLKASKGEAGQIQHNVENVCIEVLFATFLKCPGVYYILQKDRHHSCHEALTIVFFLEISRKNTSLLYMVV